MRCYAGPVAADRRGKAFMTGTEIAVVVGVLVPATGVGVPHAGASA
ncbi:hypothetical protein ACF07Y_27415 [Streptomyces sp. NPDC016566]|nr:hypothetical protein [Streptomyces sp. BK340]